MRCRRQIRQEMVRVQGDIVRQAAERQPGDQPAYVPPQVDVLDVYSEREFNEDQWHQDAHPLHDGRGQLAAILPVVGDQRADQAEHGSRSAGAEVRLHEVADRHKCPTGDGNSYGQSTFSCCRRFCR